MDAADIVITIARTASQVDLALESRLGRDRAVKLRVDPRTGRLVDRLVTRASAAADEGQVVTEEGLDARRCSGNHRRRCISLFGDPSDTSDQQNGAEYATPRGYPRGLALGIVDSIQSTGVGYPSVVAVVNRYRDYRRAQNADADQDGVADLLQTFSDLNGAEGRAARPPGGVPQGDLRHWQRARTAA